jgi:hypothetical protein
MAKEANKKFSIWAIVGIIAGVLSFMYWFSIIGVVLNAWALIQISKSKQKGKVLAIIGLVLSLIFLLLRASGMFSFSL